MPKHSAPMGDENDATSLALAGVQYRVLGPVEVGRADDGAIVPLTSSRQRLLLACLLAKAGHVVSADQLIDALWGENLPADPHDALQSHISRLRNRLGAAAAIETTPAGYRFTAPDRLDASRFERFVDEARRAGEPAAALDAWDAALALWRDRAFFDLADHPALQPEAFRLNRLRVEAAETRAETLLRLGRAFDALSAAEALVIEEPLRERPVELLMRALAASGRSVDAVRAYDTFRLRLAEEVGLDPSPELQTLEGELLRHERPETDQIRSGHPVSVGLPVATTSFIGRKDAIDRVIRTLRSSRLVTITGPGGIGKTRLALETANRHIDAFRDGAALCELGPVPAAAGVEFALAAAVGVRQQPNCTIEQSLLEALASREMLFVVDNCEHVLDGVVPRLELILRLCPGVRVLATSRERLAAEGEAVVEIPPLDLRTEAVRLLADRVAAIRPDFSPDAAQHTALMEIARRLDGLPLALELAAARIATMGPLEVARRLDDPFALLTRGRRNAPDRHRTLRATVEWSYAMLDEGEQQAFERAAVFADGFTLAAAEEVCATGGSPAGDDVADLISALADKSMIVVDDRGPTTRYRLLETLRQFGHDRLAETGRLEALEQAHADYFVKLAWRAEPQLRGPAEPEWVRLLNVEIPNLRAAWAWAMRSRHHAVAAQLSAALFWFAHWRMHTEVMSWAEELVENEPPISGPHVVPVLTTAAAAAWRRGALARARVLGERIVDTAGDEASARYGWQVLGTVAVFEGRLADARRALRESADMARREGDHYHAAIGLAGLAMAESYAGDESAARHTASATRLEALHSGAPSALAYSAYVLGEILTASSPDQALTHLDRAVALSDTVAAHFIHGIALVSATSVRVRHSDQAGAASALLDVIGHWELAGNWRQQWTTLRHAVELFARIGDDQAAATVLGAIEAHDKNLFGADAQRLSALRSELEARLGGGADEILAGGRELQPREVVAFARERLAAHRPRPRVTGNGAC